MMLEFRGKLVEQNLVNYQDITLNNVLFFKNNVKNLVIKFETFREVCFKNCKLENVTFDNCFLGKVQFLNCEFSNVNFSECNMNKVFFDNSKLTSINFFASSGEYLEITECIWQYSNLENSTINNAKFDDVRFVQNIHRHNKYISIDFYKCDLEDENFIDVNFKNCDLKTSHFKNVNINIDDLISSTLSILNVIEILSYKGIVLED